MFGLLQKLVNMFDWKNFFLCIVAIVIWSLVLAGLLAVVNLAGCKTYEPTVWNDKLPPECNMTLNTYKLYYSTADKSATVPASDYCYKKLHRIYCQEEVYGLDKDNRPNPVDYGNPVKYRDYSQCLTEVR